MTEGSEYRSQNPLYLRLESPGTLTVLCGLVARDALQTRTEAASRHLKVTCQP